MKKVRRGKRLHPWAAMTALAFEAQQVILMRTAMLAAGGPKAKKEARRMVSEKVAAAIEASQKAMTGASADTLINGYRRKVRANARRLGRG